jgi:hypothetical protein
MSKEFWAEWGVPVIGLLAAAFSLSMAWIGSWNYDRKYGRQPK